MQLHLYLPTPSSPTTFSILYSSTSDQLDVTHQITQLLVKIFPNGLRFVLCSFIHAERVNSEYKLGSTMGMNESTRWPGQEDFDKQLCNLFSDVLLDQGLRRGRGEQGDHAPNDCLQSSVVQTQITHMHTHTHTHTHMT